MATKASAPGTNGRPNARAGAATAPARKPAEEKGGAHKNGAHRNGAQKGEADARARRYDPAETRSRVLEAAYQLFAARGYASTGTADIARAAGVSEGSIFYHFGSKRALLVELGRLHGQKMIAHMQGDDPLDRLSFEVTLNRCFDFCEIHNVWSEGGCEDARNVSPGAAQPVEKGAAQCASPAASLKRNPDAEPFFNAAREEAVTWTRAHLEAIASRYGPSPVDTGIAASLIFALVGDAMQQYFHPAATAEDRRRVRLECIRFCTAAAGHPVVDTGPAA
ncbi:TetR/AcrR family transcriptional regulator [Sandaracinobacteroides sp. A072]|uniref:TetR/AcrR family transcriptional regulator n=1 Tax=Sandaracinobacteroides sp. A072 TaxID=3461146 RepID=UPI004041B8DC